MKKKGRGKRRFMTKRLPWRSTQLEELMRSLDRQEATISLNSGRQKYSGVPSLS